MIFCILILTALCVFLWRGYQKVLTECVKTQNLLKFAEHQNEILRKQKTILQAENSLYQSAQADVVIRIADPYQIDEESLALASRPTIH